MNTATKRVLYIYLIAIVFMGRLYSHQEFNNYRCTPAKPPALLVGTWIINETRSGIPTFSVMTVNEDGTLVHHRSHDQQVPEECPTKNHSIVETGVWVERDFARFQLMNNSIVDLDDIPQEPEDAPFARAQTELDITVLSEGKELSITGTTTLYKADDSALRRPLLSSRTGLPFISPIEATGLRLEFDILGLIS